MEEFLQRTKSKLNRSKRLEKVHVVLGNKPSDLDSLISTLTYAYFLDKVSPPDVLCLPVLNIPRGEFSHYTETRFILEELNIPESAHVFQDEINLHQLNDEGKLSVTLVNSNVLLASDDKSLESAVVKVINPDERCDANLELQESSSSLVVKEILQEAPELITQQLAHLLRGSILFKCMSMGPERITEKQEEILSILEEKFPELPPREEIISVFQETHFSAQGLNIEEAVLKDLKELSDGEIKIAISTVYMTLEDCIFHRNITGDLKAFVDKHGFDVLVILANYLSEEEQTKRQIAVYSENLELSNQICCELEECQNPCLELDPLECGCDQLFVYHQDNTLVTCDQILLIIKEVINRRQPEMVPNSRTSSTEAVAGSAPLSQGSSGIMELYGSDIEPQPSSVNFIENPQDINGSIQAHVDVNVDLVSPDSGLATIRSSRSSKESSVFLSDDSPVAEGAVPHHSLLPGFDSYSPIPEGAIPEEQPPQSRNNSDSFDLFSFDLTPRVTVRSQSSSHSADYSLADDFFLNSDSSEGQPPIVQKELDETNLSENDMANYSTDLLVTTNKEDSLVQFDDEFRQENPGDLSEKTSSMTDLVEDDSSSPEVLKNVETRIPPTPMNSLVESSPLDNGSPLFFPQDVIKKINEIDSASYFQSRVRYGSWWEGFELDSKSADAWSSSEQESVFQSPDSWKDRKASPLFREHLDRRASDSVFLQKQSRQMDYSRTGLWENQLNPVQNKHSLELQKKTTERSQWQSASLEETEQKMEEFTDLWKSNHTTPMISAPWHSAVDESGQLDIESYDVWTEFDQEDETKPSENVWSMPKLVTDQTSVRSLDAWAMSKTSLSGFSETTAENECENINNEISTEAWNKGRAYPEEEQNTSENTQSSIDSVQNNFIPATDNQNALSDTKCRPKQFENMGVWGLYEKDIEKEVLETLVPWEDSVLSYRCSDLSSSNTGRDSVVSPPDTNYSTSDSYISPTFIEEERENEDMHFDKEAIFDEVLNSNSAEPGILEKTDKDSLLQPSTRSMPFLSPGHRDMWNVSLNNVSHLKTEKSEISALPNIDTVLLNSEQIATKYFSGDESISETTSSSEDTGVMHVNNQTVNHLSQPHGELNDRPTAGDNNIEIWDRGILEDAWPSTRTSDMNNGLNLKTSDLENKVTVHGQVQGSINEDSKLRTQLSEHQLNLWHVHLQQNHQAGWEHKGNSGTSQQGIDEYKGMDEMSRQLTISSVWNTTLQDNSVSPSVLPKLSCITDSEESTSTAEIPNSLENIRNSDIFKDSETEKSEINMPFSSQINPVSQERWKGPLQNNTDSSAITPKEERTSGCSDVSTPQNHSHSNTPQSLPTSTDKESFVTEGPTSPEMASASEISNRGEDSQKNHSPRMPENLEIWNDTVKNSSQSPASSILINEAPEVLREVQESLSEEVHSNLDICSFRLGSSEHSLEISDAHGTSFMSESLQNKIQVNPSSESAEVPDTINMSMMDNSLSHEIDSGRSEASEGLESVIKLPDEEYFDIASHFPQIPDVWNSHVREKDSQSPGTSPETSEVVEMANTMDNLPGDTQIEGDCEEENVWSGSTNDYTQSSASSPDISDACSDLRVWGSMPAINHSEDVWNIINDNKLENGLGKKGIENKSQEESEESIDHKVPKNLDFWNAHVDDDTVSSLSSPEANEDSENSEAPLAVVAVDSNHEANGHEVPEIKELDYTQSNSISSEDSLDVDTELQNEIQMALLSNPENVKAWNISKEDNIMNLSTVENDTCEASKSLRDWERIQREFQVNTFHENTDSPHVWNSCVVNYCIAPISVAEHKEADSSKNSDIWTGSLQTDSKRVVEIDRKPTMETSGFLDGSSEWWNSQTHKDKLVERQYSSSDGSLEIHQLENIKFDAWGAPVQNEELEAAYHAHSGSHANQSPPLYFNGEKYGSTMHSINIHESGKDPDVVQLKLSDPVALGEKERGLKEQPFITVAGDQDISKNPFPEKWQPDTPNTLTQTNLKFDLSKDNVDIIPITSNKDPFVQEQWNTGETLQLCSSPQNAFIGNDSSQNIVEKSSLRGNELVEVPQATFSPYTLQAKTRENDQLFSGDPDLCADAEQLFTLRDDGENPCTLSHSDQESSSQASSSPEVCHEYEAKQGSSQSTYAWAEGGAEVSQFLFTKSNISKEADFDFKQQLVTCKVQTYPARNSQENTVETQVDDQLISPTAQECSEFRKENILKKSDLGESLTVELMDSAGSFAEDLEMTSLNLKDTCYETNSVESCPDSASVNIVSSQRHLIATTFFPLNSSEQSIKGTSVSAGTELISVSDHTEISSDKAEISQMCADGNETGTGNSSAPSIIEAPSFSEVSKLPISNNKQKVAVEKDVVDKQTLVLKTSLDGNDLGTPISQHDDNIVKETEKLLDSNNPSFKDSPNEQSPAVYSSPSDVSFNTEAIASKEIGKEEISLKQQFSGSTSVEISLSPLTPQNDEVSFFETKDSVIKDLLPFAEHPQEDHALGAETLKQLPVERESETSNIDSPADGVARSPNAFCDPLCSGEKEGNSTEIPELISTKNKEDMRTQVNKDQIAGEMDYILFTGEESISVKKDILETKESDFAFQEANVAEQTEFHEAFSAGSLDMFQSISMINESKDQSFLSTECNSFYLAEKSPSVLPQRLGDEKRSPKSPGQHHSWMVLGQNEISDLSPEEITSRTETMDSGSGHSVKELKIVLDQGWIHDTQAGVQLEKSLHKSFEQEEYSPLDSLTRQDKNSGIIRTDALLLQVVNGHGKWEVHSRQHPEDGMATERDMEEETEFLNSERELNQASRLVPEDVGMDIPFKEGVVSPDATEIRREPPNSLDLNGSHPRRIKLIAPNINLSLDRSEGSVLSDDNLETPDEIDINVDDLDTPDEADSFEYAGNEDQGAIRDVFQEESESIPEYTAEEEREDNRLWRTVVIGEQEQRIDMKVIEPYKKVISHGGYYGDGLNAIIVFAACFLPDSSRADYNHVMENLFLYVISTLELMVAEDYMIVYLNGATPRRKMPGFGWLKKCYQMIDRSSKFSSKIQYVGTLAELSELIPMEYVHIPESIVKLDEELREASETAKLDAKLQKKSRNFQVHEEESLFRFTFP